LIYFRKGPKDLITGNTVPLCYVKGVNYCNSNVSYQECVFTHRLAT